MTCCRPSGRVRITAERGGRLSASTPLFVSTSDLTVPSRSLSRVTPGQRLPTLTAKLAGFVSLLKATTTASPPSTRA